MNFSISVLVPTVGSRKRELIRLFDSLIAQKYGDMEVVVVAQGGFDMVKNLCESYSGKLSIIYLETDKRGLSRARNLGLHAVHGDIVLLSDDDCWYEEKAILNIANFFEKNIDADILLTQIYDPIAKLPYKNYPKDKMCIKKMTALLSKSSIEIAFRRNNSMLEFDELFGLGARYVAGEEVDYLIRSLRSNKKIKYEPIVTVYHEKKANKESNEQIMAKGAFYSKNFGFVVSNLVLLRDLFKKHQNNYKWFWRGYFDYKKQS